MKPAHTRDDVLDLAAFYAPTRACGRRIKEVGATVYRGINPLTELPGYLVQVQGQSREWFIGLYVDEIAQRWKVVYYDAQPAGFHLLEGNRL